MQPFRIRLLAPPRFLPLAIVAVVLMLSVRVGHLWQNFSVSAGAPSAAQTADASTAGPSAGEAPAPAAQPADGVETVAVDGAAPDAPPVEDPFGYSDEELDVLQSLAERRKQLDERERQMGEREALLMAAEQRVDAKLAELKALQQALAGVIEERDAEQEAKLKSLVKIYENMKPKEAAAIFQRLEMETLLEVVDRMKEAKAAPILAQMDPAKAMEVTFELARQGKVSLAQ